MGRADPHLITLHRRGSDLVLRVDCARWGQTPEDLRHLALSAPHARTRERALALFDITQHRCATQVAMRTGRRAHTVMDWVHAYNAQGPDALAFRRTGGRRPFFLDRQSWLADLKFESRQVSIRVAAEAGAQGPGLPAVIETLAECGPSLAADPTQLAHSGWVQ